MAIEDDTKELFTDKRHVDSNNGITTGRLLSESIVQREPVQFETVGQSALNKPSFEFALCSDRQKEEGEHGATVEGAAQEVLDSGKRHHH